MRARATARSWEIRRRARRRPGTSGTRCARPCRARRTRRRCPARRRSTSRTRGWSAPCRSGSRGGGQAALAAGPDAVARRRLGRLRPPAPEPRAARLRRANGGRPRAGPPPGGPPPLHPGAPLRRIHLAAPRSDRGRPGGRGPRAVRARGHLRSPLAGGVGRGDGGRPFGDALCRRAAARWWRGTRAEQRVLTAGSLRSPIYAAVVREKLGGSARRRTRSCWPPVIGSARRPSCARTTCSCSGCKRSTTSSTASRMPCSAAATFRPRSAAHRAR